jgi:D-aminopeptidase
VADKKPLRRRRARALGIRIGRYKPGRHNAITDVKGVRVGHATIVEKNARTGVTAILPNKDIYHRRVIGSGFVLNGAGEVSGLTQVMEWGLIETPILLTNTMSVGRVSDAAVNWMLRRHEGIGKEHDVVIPVVGECDDSWLNEVRGRHIKQRHVFDALDLAVDGRVPEGSVGGGTGMITCDFKAGIGTSSRHLPDFEGEYVVGVLVQSNFGRMDDLRIDGVPVGQILAPKFESLAKRYHSYGSIIAVVATDAPLLTHQLARLAKRVALGIGRSGSYAAHGSGEIVIAFSVANLIPRQTHKMVARTKFLLDDRVNALYIAAIEATEEAILNALCMAEDMEGVAGHFCPALPLADTVKILERHGRIQRRGRTVPPTS